MKMRIRKIFGTSIVILLLISVFTTIAMGVFEKKIESYDLSSFETTNGLPYEARLLIYVTEPVSRWNMFNQEPYHFGSLGYAYDGTISLEYLDTFEETIIWDGDVEEENVMVMAAVFNAGAHVGYANPPDGNPFEAHYTDASAAAIPGEVGYNTVTDEFSHTVFVEEGTATWCHNCPDMAEVLHTVYASGDYPFYYVALIDDKSPGAPERLINDYNRLGFPTAFFDGGYEVLIGSDTTEQECRDAIESCGQADVHELNITLSVEYIGDGDLQIDIHITNDEDFPYPIIEIGDVTSDLTDVQSVVRNVGSENANDVEWSVNIKGGILGLIDVTTEGTIETLDVGEEIPIQTEELFFGFGKVDIIIEADEAGKIAQGFVVGPFIVLHYRLQ